MLKICSFDVFDTCLTRRVVTPVDVFRLMAPDVARLANLPCSENWVEEFVRLRVFAEKVSRRGKPDSETNIFSIWNELRNILKIPDHPYEDIELKWEEELCISIPRTLAKVSQARSEKIKILFISDMYLPSNFIKKLLVKHDFFHESDQLYVSCEIGATKSSGLLYKHIQRELGIPLECITHHGDNFYSDIQKPRSFGFNVNHITDAQMNRHEEALRKTSEVSPSLSSQIAGAMRASRFINDHQSNMLATHFVTPFLFLFVSWVLRQADSDGVKRLYFLGRDCQLAYKFSNHPLLAKSGIDCRYLQASRRAYMLASVFEVSPRGIPWLDRENDEKETVLILKKLELEYGEFNQAWTKIAKGAPAPHFIHGEDEWNIFWQVLSCESIKTKILKSALDKREALQKYLVQEGIFEKSPAAIVDLGWTFSIQRAAELVLRELNPDFSLGGYYLGASFERFNDVSAQTLFLPKHPSDQGSRLSCSFFPDRATLLEHIIGKCTHSTLRGFDCSNQVVDPIFDHPTSISYTKDTEKFHDLALKSLNYYTKISTDKYTNHDLRSILRELISQTFDHPSYELALGARNIGGSSNPFSIHEKPLVLPYGWVDFFMALFRIAKASPSRFWVEGSLAITPRSIRGLARRFGFINRLIAF